MRFAVLRKAIAAGAARKPAHFMPLPPGRATIIDDYDARQNAARELHHFSIMLIGDFKRRMRRDADAVSQSAIAAAD